MGAEMTRAYDDVLKENAYLKRMNKALSEKIFQDDITEYPWLGNLGHWFWDLTHNEVTFNPLKSQAIGYTKEELPEKVTFAFFTEKVHPGDYHNIMDEMRNHLKGEVSVWEVKYRIQAKDGTWKVFYDRGKVTQRDKNGAPLLLSGIVFDITEDELQRQDLINKTQYWHNKARYDSLTQLYTRSELDNLLLELANYTTVTSKGYSLMFLDIDHFKRINDVHGHLTGDRVLNKVGAIIKEIVRASDIAGRYGGDEFLLAFPNLTKEQTLFVGERIQKQVEQTDFGISFKPTLTGGIASNDEAMDLKSVLELADKRLYQAKKSGRNQICFLK